MRRARVIIGAACVAVLGVSPAAVAAGRLPPSPFEVDVSPGTVREGHTTHVHVSIPPGRGAQLTGPVDVYVARSVGWRHFVFLAPDGRWSVAPVPLRTAASLESFAPVTAAWPRERVIGWSILTLLVVSPSTTPLARDNWLVQPVIRMVAQKASLAGDLAGAGSILMLAVAGLVTVALGVLIAVHARSRT